MSGNGLTYGAYHLALYLFTVMAWGGLGLRFLLLGTGGGALLRCCAMLAVALLISAVMLALDILRVLEQHEVERALLFLGVLLPGVLALTWKGSSIAGKLKPKEL